MKFVLGSIVLLCVLCCSFADSSFDFAQVTQDQLKQAEVQNGVCDYNKINGALLQVAEVLKSVNETGDYDVTKFLVASLATIAPTLQCLGKVGAWLVPGTQKVTKFTDKCLHVDKNKNEWKKDPCCNKELENTQCCVAKNVTIDAPKVASFRPELDAACSNPTKVKNLINLYIDEYTYRTQECTSNVERKIQKDFELLGRMVQCWYRVYSSTDDCTSDADCNGGKCDFVRGKCAIQSQENIDPVLKCVLVGIPEWLKRVFRLKLGLKGKDAEATLFTTFKQWVTKEECFVKVNTGNPHTNNYVFTKSPLGKTLCEFKKVCNNPNDDQCNSAGKCVTSCGFNGVCNEEIKALANQEALCKSAGYCLGNGVVDKSGHPYNASSCAQQKMCSALHLCNENSQPACTEAACTKLGFCKGFPLVKASCVYSFQFGAQGEKKCGIGQDQKEFGCISQHDQNTCKNNGGTFVALPTNKAECEQWKHCVNNDTKIISQMSEATCGKCGGTYETAFKWIPAQWTQARLIQPQKWQASQKVSENRYITGVDVNRLTQLVTSVILLQAVAAYKSMIQCAYIPLIKLSHSIACDCGTPKAPNGTTCFAPLTATVGTFKVFAGLKVKVTTSDADITPDPNAVSTDKDNVNAQIVKTDASTLSTSTNNDLMETLATASGYLVSDGIAVQTESGGSLGGKTNLCIKRTKSSAPAEYTVAGFATVSNGQILRSSVTITNQDYSLEMCGDVTDGKTYYAAFFKPGTPVSNNSNKVAFSAIIFVFAVIMSLFA